jgi:hypothetical protein
VIRHPGRGLSGLAVTGGVAAAGPGCPAPDATHFEVTNSSASGAGSLDQAFTDATAANGGSICLDQGLATITLVGSETYGGSGTLAIEGNGGTVQSPSGIIDVANASNPLVTVHALTLTGTTASGVIIFSSGPVTLTAVTITGGIEGLRSSGPGGTVTVTDSTIRGSVSGLETSGNDINLVRSTISGIARRALDTNTGPATATLVNSTVSGNASSAGFSGIAVFAAVLVYSTVVGNGTGANGDHNILTTGDLTAFGSVVALKGTGTSCSIGGTTHTHGYNYSDDSSCNFTDPTDHQAAANPLLGPLAANGGATQTRAPQTGSPLIDAIPLSSCQNDGATGITTDQRSLARPSGSGCDIGAVEVQAAAAIVVTPRFTG